MNRSLACLCGLVMACVEAPAPEAPGPEAPSGANLLGMGDSIFSFNLEEGQSIPEVVARDSGHVARNAAQGGAWLTQGLDHERETIGDQWVPGDWNWLVFDGGGNDLNDRCACGDCDAVLNEIITADATAGVIVDIVDDAVASGTKVVFMGYPELPPDAALGFDRCGPWFARQNERVQALAARVPSFFFVDAADVVSASDTDLYVDDRVHPTPEGSRVMGAYIAETINANP